MRLSTVFISSTFVLAGMGTAFPVERENTLMARFADSDFLSEVKARAYGEEAELYAHKGDASRNNYKSLSRRRRSFYEPPRYKLTRRRGDGHDLQHLPPLFPDRPGPNGVYPRFGFIRAQHHGPQIPHNPEIPTPPNPQIPTPLTLRSQPPNDLQIPHAHIPQT